MRKLNLEPPAANSKRLKPIVMPFVKILELSCLNIPSNVDTEVTTQIVVFNDKVGAILT